MKSFILGLLAALVFAPATLLGYFLLGFAPIHSDAKPSAAESAVMQFVVRSSVRHQATKLPYKAAENEQAVIAGGKLYVQGCADCHGELGKPFHEDQANFPPVPQFITQGTRYSEAEVAWIINHGIRMTAMSAYGRFYTAEQLVDLAAFVKVCSHLPSTTVDLILAKDSHSSPPAP